MTIRSARPEDSRFVYELAMLPAIRAASTRSDAFTFEQHQEWWKKKLRNGRNAIYIMEVDGRPVGQVRYGLWDESCESCADTPSRHCCAWNHQDEAEIAISVLPSEWRRGYALTMLLKTARLACKQLAIRTLVALVLRTNYPSRHLFREAGFRYVGAEKRMGKWHARYEK